MKTAGSACGFLIFLRYMSCGITAQGCFFMRKPRKEKESAGKHIFKNALQQYGVRLSAGESHGTAQYGLKCSLLAVFVFRDCLVLLGYGLFAEFAENSGIRDLEHIVLLRVLCRIAILLPQYAQKLFGGAAVNAAVGDHIADNGNMFGGYSEIAVCRRILPAALIKA